MLRRLVAIVGPTAAGKSAIALELARRLGGEILNGDSRQIYRGMDIGTAKPAAGERRGVRHHLFDICEPGERYSLARFQRDAREAMETIWERGSFPWLVGGTGQYIWSLLEDWQIPGVPPDDALRRELSEVAERDGARALHVRLEAADPVAAERIDARNVRRVVRALEVFEATGTPISTWQTKGDPDFEYLLFGVATDREKLHRKIELRTEAMFAAGFVAEVRGLLAAGIPGDASAMSSIGYAEVIKHLKGEIDLAAAQELMVRTTKRLAKRQLQWFKPSDKRIRWVETVDDIDLEANIFTGACTNALLGSSRW